MRRRERMKKRVLTWLTAVCMVLTMLPLPAAWAAETVTFSDVTDRNTAMAVETLRLMDVLDGYGDGTFRPEAILTRAQFCKMVVYAMDAIQNPVSLFEPVYTEGGDTLYVMDQISDTKNKEDRWIEDLSLREAMKRLSKREKHIIELRFYEGKTQMEVAQEIGISQAQVSRLEKNALKSMRNYLRT